MLHVWLYQHNLMLVWQNWNFARVATQWLKKQNSIACWWVKCFVSLTKDWMWHNSTGLHKIHNSILNFTCTYLICTWQTKQLAQPYPVSLSCEKNSMTKTGRQIYERIEAYARIFDCIEINYLNRIDIMKGQGRFWTEGSLWIDFSPFRLI